MEHCIEVYKRDKILFFILTGGVVLAGLLPFLLGASLDPGALLLMFLWYDQAMRHHNESLKNNDLKIEIRKLEKKLEKGENEKECE
jgi:membrane protein CcdC involved in cytochrome C biogenesis